MIKLTKRLEKVSSFIEKNDVVCDVGTDHGYIPAYLVQNGIISRAVATDINEGPLNNAKKTAKMCAVSDKIDFYHTNGLEGVPEGEINAVIIAGMGGETIRDILSGCPWVKSDKKLILQPQSKIEDLVLWLWENDFGAYDMCLTKDEGRIYVIMAVKYGEKRCSDYLAYLREKDDPLFLEYIERLISVQNKIVAGLSKGKERGKEYENALAYLNHLESLRGN